MPTPLHWSTDEVAPRFALAWWADVIGDQMIELDIDAAVPGSFRARIDQYELGPATAHFVTAQPQRLRRTRGRISRSRHEVSVLLHLREGRVRLSQRGREALVLPGTCVLMDGSEPYDIDCSTPTTALALKLPQSWLRRWVPHSELHTARVLACGGWNSALCASLASLTVDSCGKLALPGDVVAEQLGATFALALGSEPGGRPPESLLDQIIGTLRERFQEPDLTVDSVAAQHGISRRLLFLTFSRAGTSFIEQLMQLRLDHAHRMLLDLHSRDLPIGEVSARSGFADPSHFARRFRQRYGSGPAQLRRSLLL